MHEVNAKSILTKWNGMNIYRGCTHGCIYCDSRSKCYYMDHDFTDIEVKVNAPILLEDILRRKEKCMISTGSMSDPYMPLESNLKLTRACLELIDKYHFGATIITKSSRILRDLDILESINNKTKCVVQMTLTTYDDNLCHILEPNVSYTKERIEVLKVLRDHHIPTVVWLTPILPFINDNLDNIQALMNACIEAKVKGIVFLRAGMTLREGSREYYYQQLDKYFPTLKEKYIQTYNNKQELMSPNNHIISKYIKETCIKHNILLNEETFHYTSTLEEETLFDFI